MHTHVQKAPTPHGCCLIVNAGERTGRRVLARKLKGAELASWYFIPPFVPGLHNEAKE